MAKRGNKFTKCCTMRRRRGGSKFGDVMKKIGSTVGHTALEMAPILGPMILGLGGKKFLVEMPQWMT